MKYKILCIRLIWNYIIFHCTHRNTCRSSYLNTRISQFSITIVFSSYNYPCNVCCHNRNVKNVNYLVCSSMPPQLLWHNGTRNMNICWPNISNKARSEWIWKHATAIYYYSDDNALSLYINLISLFLNILAKSKILFKCWIFKSLSIH